MDPETETVLEIAEMAILRDGKAINYGGHLRRLFEERDAQINMLNKKYEALAKHHNQHCTCMEIY